MMTGSILVAEMEEMELAKPTDAADVMVGDSVCHPTQGDCVVLARIGDTLMVELQDKVI